MPIHPLAHEDVVGVICAYNEEENIGKAVRTLCSIPEIDEVLVVDGWSGDKTEAVATGAGARVVHQKEERYPGKGVAVQSALEESDQPILVFFDADIRNMERWQVERLIEGVTVHGADHAMARFTRKAGRVTELTAKPLFAALFPEVRYEQPLTGEYATHRGVMDRVEVVPDWGVESGLVIDLTMMDANVIEVPTGYKDHPMKALPDLRIMAGQVVRTILQKAVEYGRITRRPQLDQVLTETGEQETAEPEEVNEHVASLSV